MEDPTEVKQTTHHLSQAGANAKEEGIRDVAANLFLESKEYTVEELQSERDIVRRRLDWVIMPMSVSSRALLNASR
jgi:hypothetical protein